jgi:hypothetical protein
MFQDRRTFLLAASRVCPEFWDTLRDNVLPCWPRNAQVSIHSIRRGYLDPALTSIQPSFLAWTERFHIETVTWLHRIALMQLRAWSENPEVRGWLGLMSALEWGDSILSFEWDPKLETAAACVSRLEREVRAVSDSAEKCPLPLSDLHAEWLALYQLAGLSPSAIQKRAKDGNARGIEDDTSAIRKGYQSAATRLNIALRPQRRGRPRRK